MWDLSKQQESRVQATHMRVLRRIEGVGSVDSVRNEDIRLRLGQESILDAVHDDKTGEVKVKTARNE